MRRARSLRTVVTRTIPLLGLLTSAAPLWSCGTANPPTDVAPTDATDDSIDAAPVDVPPPPMCPTRPPLMTGDPMGAANPLTVPAGQTRAGRLSAGDIPNDPNRLSLVTAGDYVLANDRIAVAIEAPGASDGYDPFGGRPIAVARVADGRMVEPADFGEAIFAFGRFLIATETVTVMRDGSMGGNAVIRAEGPFRGLPFIVEIARGILPGNFEDLRGAIDYELAPNSNTVTITVHIDSPRTSTAQFTRILGGFFQNYRMPSFVPGVGVTNDMASMPMPYIAFSSPNQTGWAWVPAMGDLEPFIQTTGFDGFFMPTFAVAPCSTTTNMLARIVVGSGPHLDGVLTAVAGARSEMRREIRGTVTDSAGMPAANVHVHAQRMGGAYETGTVTDSMGAFTLHVPTGAAMQLTGFRRGDALAGPVTVGATETMAPALRIGPSGIIHVAITEPAPPAGMGRGLPVRVQVIPLAGTTLPAVPESFGEFSYGNGRLHIAFPTNGTTDLRAPVGRYHVVASRGFEYTILERDVEVTANGTANFEGSLEHVVDTAGAVCGDFHIHTHRSPDSEDTGRTKLSAIAGDGVDLAVRSDHEFVNDFEPYIEELGLRPWLRSVPSLELTTFGWGHFGVVPLIPQPNRPNGGNFEWSGRMPPDVFNEVRAREGSPTLIINHPRTGGSLQGYFNAAGFDPMTGVGSRAGYWDTQFTAAEFFNDSSFEENRAETVRDWYALLRAGRRVFAVGSSDSHHVLTSGPVGYPRTCLRVGTDDPAMVTNNQVRDGVGRGNSVIYGGIYVTATAANNTGPGGEVTGAGAMAPVRVTVQAPPWVRPERLEVIVDGATVQMINIPATGPDTARPALRLSQDVMVPVSATGSYAIFHVSGAGDLAPVNPGKKPFGVTNPIFFRR